jgi:hypothetical protein
VLPLLARDLRVVLSALAIAGTIVAWTAHALLRERRLGFPLGATARELRPAVQAVALASGVAVLAGNLAVAAFCAPGAGWLGYHRELLDMIAGYGLTMGHRWSLGPGQNAALGAVVVFLVWWTLRRAATAPGRERAQLLALLAAAAVCGRSAFTRSDLGHIALAFTPMVVLLAVLAGSELRRTRRLAAAPLGAVLLLFAGWPLIDAGGIARALGAPARFDLVLDRLGVLHRAEIDRRDVVRRAAQRRGMTARLFRARSTLGGRPLAVVPWENHLAIALGAPPAGAILQAYAAHTPEVQERYLAALRAAPETQVLLAVDHLGTKPIDGVLTAVRLPRILRGLLEELEPASPSPPGSPLLLLERRPSPRRLRVEPLAIEVLAGTGLTLASVALPSTPCRLLAVELVLSYPPWVALGRPEPLDLKVLGSGGAITASRVVPLRAGAAFEILVPLISMERYASLWSEAAGPGPEVTALRLGRVSESLATAPSRSEVRSVSCLEW